VILSSRRNDCENHHGQALAVAAPAAAQSPEDFYRGKTVSLLSGSQPGGAYDAYARLQR
jgi:hypothetical protein